MRNYIRLTLLMLMFSLASDIIAQNLTAVRFYFDDPASGYQNFSVPNLASIDQPFSVDVSSQTAGMHRLYIEIKDSNGKWSLYDSKMVQIVGGLSMATINAVEYFFDTDPGLGNGINVAVSGTNVSQAFDLDISSLTNGVHLLYIRVKDADNQWSIADKKLIHIVGSVMEELVAMEYFYDVDPGFGNGQSIDIANLTTTSDFNLEIANLPTGVHLLYLRVKDSNGLWSLVDKKLIQVTNPVEPSDLVQAEYYFDTDPGLGNGYPLTIPQQNLVDGDFNISIPNNLTGTHTVCIRVLNGAGFWSSVSCQSFTVCNIATPAITVTGSNCQSAPYQLSVPAGQYDSVVWSTNSNATSISVTQPGVYSVTVSDNGCTTSTSITTDFQLMPEPTITVTGSVCQGDNQLITISPAFDSYLWQDGSESASLSVNQSGDYSVQVFSGSCSSTEIVHVEFIQPSSITIAQTGNGCVGDAQTLSVDNTFTNVLWNNATSGNSLNINQSGTYSVSANNSGCPVSTSINVVLSEVPAFEIQAVGGNCEGDNVVLTATPNSYSYVWFDNSTGSSNTVNQSGNYGVTAYNGTCSATASYALSLTSLPQPSIVANTNALLCEQGGYTYQWYFNGTPISGATSQIYNATQSGFYSVEISASNCSEISSIFNHIFIGVEENALSIFELFPNPVKDVLTIESPMEVFNYVILDVSGRIIVRSNSTSKRTQVDLRSFASGQYFIKIYDNSTFQVRAFIKE